MLSIYDQFDDSRDTNFNRIKNILRSSIFCYMTVDYKLIKEIPLRRRDIPYNLDKNHYGVLLRPHDKDKSILIKYFNYVDDTINISVNIRLNGYTGPRPHDRRVRGRDLSIGRVYCL